MSTDPMEAFYDSNHEDDCDCDSANARRAFPNMRDMRREKEDANARQHLADLRSEKL